VDALEMKPYEKMQRQQREWDFAVALSAKPNPLKAGTVRGSQLEQPLFEFSSACAGCGETPYLKLLTQLFGSRLMIAGATGCSSIYGAPFAENPWCTLPGGNGPTWANSLFEDNAEFGLGMHLAYQTRRAAFKEKVILALELLGTDELRQGLKGEGFFAEAADTNLNSNLNGGAEIGRSTDPNLNTHLKGNAEVRRSADPNVNGDINGNAEVRGSADTHAAESSSANLADALQGWQDLENSTALMPGGAGVARASEVAQQLEQQLNRCIGVLVKKPPAQRGTLQRTLRGILLETLQDILAQKNLLINPSQWIVGGDGWGYDIGYGGLDHVLASGENVNVLVMDNEVYANTGGQSSKATPAAAIAKFAASGKRIAKKDLAYMAISYGKVYVATVSAGANKSQLVRAFTEAEKFDGPSLVVAYTPCISHGLRGGLKNSLAEAQEAVECGYWPLFRYNPALSKPFKLDYKTPDFDKMQEFMMKQSRFSALRQVNPEHAQALFDKTVADARRRFDNYQKLL
jgi:pyruvate-ferredoxin/flavodoxin oxidoreductase